jgi:hypothetical protein
MEVQIKMQQIGSKKEVIYLMHDIKQCVRDFDKIVPGALIYISKNRNYKKELNCYKCYLKIALKKRLNK